MNTISIVTPVRNASDLLIETMISISSQIGLGTQFNIQHIIVDGQSGDDTLFRAKNFIQENERVGISYHIISEADSGMYDAISKGFAVSTGEIIAYQNAGDLYHVGAFAAVNHLFMNCECTWAYGRKASMNIYGTCVSDAVAVPYLESLLRSGFHGMRKPNLGFFQQESLFFRACAIKNFDFDQFRNFRLAGDFFLILHLAKKENGFFIDALLSGHRVHENQLSSDKDAYFREMREVTALPGLKSLVLAILMKILSKFPQPLLRRAHTSIMKWDSANHTWVIQQE